MSEIVILKFNAEFCLNLLAPILGGVVGQQFAVALTVDKVATYNPLSTDIDTARRLKDFSQDTSSNKYTKGNGAFRSLFI